MEFNGLDTEAVIGEAVKHATALSLQSVASTLENISLLLIDRPEGMFFSEAPTNWHDISAAKRTSDEDEEYEDDEDYDDEDFEDDEDFDDDFEDDYDEEDFDEEDIEEDFYEEDFDLEEDFDDEDFEDDFGSSWDDRF